MENLIILAIFLMCLIGAFAVADFIVGGIIKYRERKYHEAVMNKVWLNK